MKHKHLTIILFMFFLKGYSQLDSLITTIDSSGHYYFFTPNSTKNTLSDFQNYIGGLNSNISLSVRSSQIGPNDVYFSIYEQSYRNVIIENCPVFMRSKNSHLISANGFIEKNISLPSLSGALSFSYVVNQLLTSLNRDLYKWQDSTWENHLKTSTNNSAATYFPAEDIRIVKLNPLEYNSSGNYKYAYRIPISSMSFQIDSTFTDSIYYMDALTGTLLRTMAMSVGCHPANNKNNVIYKAGSESELDVASSCNGNCQQNGVTLYFYGGQDIYTEHTSHNFGCSYRLHDNCTGTPLFVKETPFASINDIWSTNSGWPQTADRKGTTALWSLRTSRDYYADVWNRYSYDNQNSEVGIVIKNNGNASTQWSSGTSGAAGISIGSTNSSWDVSLDIIGHELTHGINANTAALGSGNDDEGGLNEGFADIFGEMIEFYAAGRFSFPGNIADYVHGGLYPFTQVGFTRNLANPQQYNQADTYNGTYYNTTKQAKAGVIGHWFYLLANGSGGSYTNDNNASYCVFGIGREKAEKIAYYTLTSYLGNTGKNYPAARLASIQAAAQIYGLGSNELAQVISAWNAVGVGTTPVSSYMSYVQLGSKTETSSAGYNYNNPLRLDLYTVQPYISVNVSSGQEITISSTHYNPPIYPPTYGDTKISLNSEFRAYIAPGCSGGARMYNSHSDDTNSSDKQHSVLTDAMDIFPNPNNGNFSIHLDENEELPKKIIVMDVHGREVTKITNPESYLQNIEISGSSSGMYIVNVYYNDKVISKKIVKN